MGRGWNKPQMLNLPQNSLRKSLLCVPIFSFCAYLLAEAPQRLWHSWGDFLEGYLKLPGMEVAQSLASLLPFRKNICENCDCAHFQAGCYIDKQNCCWVGLLKSQFCRLSVGKKTHRKSAFHGDVFNSTTQKSFPSATSPLNVKMWHFQACDLGVKV